LGNPTLEGGEKLRGNAKAFAVQPNQILPFIA
jgi:hypothetical protein